MSDTKPSPRLHGRFPGDRPCAVPGCLNPGEFRAPAESPRGEGAARYRWLCLDHVREFNAGYNFFAGMTPDEIAAAQTPYAGWERETRAFASTGADAPPRWRDFADPMDAMSTRFGPNRPRERADGRALSAENRRDLATLELPEDADRRALRRRYADLVRRFHPDRNGGDRRHERRLGEVIAAYDRLKRAPLFA